MPEYQSVAVVDAADDRVVVWQVDIGADAGLTRMCGAWVIDPGKIGALKNLTQSRYLVATPMGAKACAGAGADGHTGVIDLRLIIEAVDAEIRCLQTAFDTALVKSKSKLIAPTWPRLPNPINLADPPRDRNAPDEVAAALGIARWLETVALAWESLEQQRLARRYLKGKEAIQRPLPIRLAS